MMDRMTRQGPSPTGNPAPQCERVLNKVTRAARWRNTLLRVLPLALTAAVCNVAAANPNQNQTCAGSEVDCGYFGCFPPGRKCPADCDTNKAPETCRAVRTADNRQACVFNPQYSEGKGLCQKDVVCYNLPFGQCSSDCFRCHYFGCLPSGTNCPKYCEELGSAQECETLGGVAGGFACQWDRSGGKCGEVPLSNLTRRLDPTPILAHAALTITTDGVTVTPSNYPVDSRTPTPAPAPAPQPKPTSDPDQFLDWAGARDSPTRVALYVGFSIAALGLVSLVALLLFRRRRKAERDRALAAVPPPVKRSPPSASSASSTSEWDSDSDSGSDSDSDNGSEDGEEAAGRADRRIDYEGEEEREAPAHPPVTLFNRDSLLDHIREAVGDYAVGQQLQPSQESPSRDSGSEKHRRSVDSAVNPPFAPDRTPGGAPQLGHDIPPTILARRLSSVTSIEFGGSAV